MQFLRYLIAGLINTAVGYGAFWALLNFFPVAPGLANAASYVVALSLSYFLNKYFVFGLRTAFGPSVPKFIVAFLISFVINQIVLVIFFRVLNWAPEMAQIPAMASYTLSFFLLNRNFVFSREGIRS